MNDKLEIEEKLEQKITIKPKLILHICCAVCGAYLIDLLKNQFEIILYFYNPNIWPKEEYDKRLKEAEKLAEIYQINFQEGEYNYDLWLEKVRGWESEPEGGKRCLICFRERLEKTAEIAKKEKSLYFTTTLAISPFKDEKVLDEIATLIAKENNLIFLPLSEFGDKKELWKKTQELSKKYELYHQKYCGCQFSFRPTKKEKDL
ncbi:MAG TPA: epoxyqueuosine reductase QueH [Candidatus Paceibacterota bacterium]|nr:epoxyqueuosine reductase QueH [Candidatus Paceibacterota bacterium]